MVVGAPRSYLTLRASTLAKFEAVCLAGVGLEFSTALAVVLTEPTEEIAHVGLLKKCLRSGFGLALYSILPYKRWRSVAELTCHLKGFTPSGITYFKKPTGRRRPRMSLRRISPLKGDRL
jgi:hypothetical protein